MSRNYAHSRINRVSGNRRRRNNSKGFKPYLLLIIILLVIIFMARDITPTVSTIEQDLTNQIRSGEFIK
jgi:hypothetical protein